MAQKNAENAEQQVTEQPKPRIASAVKVFPNSFVDKKGKSRKSLVMTVDGETVDYVSWDKWLELSKVFAKCAAEPEFGLKLAAAFQSAYVKHAGEQNGASQRGDSLI